MEDRVFTDKDIRLWRVSTVVHVFATEDDHNLTDYRFDNPIPVYSGDILVGAATLEIKGRQIHADLAMDYAIPERLEVETGEKIWALPYVVSTVFVRATETDTGKAVVVPTIRKIDSLWLRRDGLDNLPALGEPSL